MLTIKMIDGSIWRFANKDYTEYDITQNFVVVKRDDQWIGVFARDSFMLLIVDAEGNEAERSGEQGGIVCSS